MKSYKKIIIAVDSFRDFASSKKVGNWIKEGMMEVIPEGDIEVIPIADGGEGTVEVLVEAFNGSVKKVKVRDALFRITEAEIGVVEKNGDQICVVEIAQASGMQKLRPPERNTIKASSYGTGELIKYALKLNCNKVIVGLGGSIISDAGMGAAYALGAKFLDKYGSEISFTRSAGYTVEALPLIHKIEINGLEHKIKDKEFIVAADVNNPLLGPNGQARTFGPQKGAKKDEIEFIEYALTNYAKVLYECFGKNYNVNMAGAAGGLGAGLTAFLNAKLVLGINYIMNYINFKGRISRANLLITGEGCLDETTLNSKACLEIAKEGRRYNIPVIGVFGSVRTNPEIFDTYFNDIIDSSNGKNFNVCSEDFRNHIGPERLINIGRRIANGID